MPSVSQLMKIIEEQKEQIVKQKEVIENFINPNNQTLLYLQNIFFTNWTEMSNDFFENTNNVVSMFQEPLDEEYIYYFITQTYDQNFFLPNTPYKQELFMLNQLKYSVDEFYHAIFGSIEFHNNGNIHSHFLIKVPHRIQLEISCKLYTRFTNNPKVYKINHDVKIVKNNDDDLQRVIQYIIKDRHYIFRHL